MILSLLLWVCSTEFEFLGAELCSLNKAEPALAVQQDCHHCWKSKARSRDPSTDGVLSVTPIPLKALHMGPLPCRSALKVLVCLFILEGTLNGAQGITPGSALRDHSLTGRLGEPHNHIIYKIVKF